jgi:hypothetical protein
MSALRNFLDRVLGGSETVQCRGEFELLRRVASIDQLEKLEEIEKQFQEAERRQRTSTTPQALDSANAERIIRQTEGANVTELQQLLAQARELKLTTGQIESIRARLAALAAQKYRGDGTPTELKRIGFTLTPFGPVDRFTVNAFERLRAAGFRAIDDCLNHSGRGCACCGQIRETVWSIRARFSSDTPEVWLCDRLLDDLASYDQLKPGQFGN